MSDTELSLSPVKKNQARQGRRAVEDSWLEGDEKDRPRRTVNAGWGESQRSDEREKEKDEEKDEEEEGEDLPIIPDLEEVEKEDFAQRVADAPNVAVNRVDTYKELDSDLFKHAAFATLEEVDLRLLTRHMVPESALKEPDESWAWASLFADVSSQMQSEWCPGSEADTDNTQPAGSSVENNERPYTAFNKFPV